MYESLKPLLTSSVHDHLLARLFSSLMQISSMFSPTTTAIEQQNLSEVAKPILVQM